MARITKVLQETCIGKRQKIMYMNVACYLIKPFPFIAATPDGKICANGQSGLLEIKCPFSVRDKTITEVLADPQKQDFFLQLNGESIE